MHVRPTKTEDLPALQMVLDETGVFPSDMLPQMIKGFLTDEHAPDLWMTSSDPNGTAVGFCYVVPEEFADGTWNMLAIAVHPEQQGSGYGAALVEAVEEVLREKRQRVLLVDTSSHDDFTRTREFYRKNGYAEEARIRDFWAEGDDKITFWKRLTK
jgi:ribosomal protein S18 acetylase RimI-like enzyme